MNSHFNSETSTPNEILHSSAHHLQLYYRNYSRNLDDAFERKKNTYEDGFSKIKYLQEKSQQNQAGNEVKKTCSTISKPSKLYSQQNIMEKIDRILLKNALSHMKPAKLQPNMNTSIEQGNYFTNPHENIQRQRSNAPFITQNGQLQRQNGIKSRKTKPKLQISTIRSNTAKNHTITIIDSYRNKQFPKANLEQYKLKSEIATPSQNEWQNSMNLIRLEKKQSEKSKNYCRIMIRRINTDQIFTKRAQSHKKIASNKICQLNSLKRIKPIRNIMSEATPLKKPKNIVKYDKTINSDAQNIELNPWSTTEIKLRQQNEPLHPF